MRLSLRSIVPDRVSTPAKYFLFAGVLNGFGNGIFGVVIQLYLMTLGFKSSALGSIFMMNSIGMVLLTLPAGILADRYGKGKIMIFGFVVTGLAFLLILTGTSIEMFSLAWFLLGLGNATGTVFGPLYSSLFDRRDMDRAFGLRGFINILCNSVGSLMGFVPPMLVDRYGFSLQSSYWILLAIGTGFFFVQMPFYLMVLRGVDEPKGQQGFKFNLRSKGVVAKFSILYTIQNLALGSFFGLFPYYVNTKFGAQSDALGALYFASRFIQAGGNAVAPRIAKRMGTLKTVSAALGLCTPFWLMFPLAPNFTWISIVYISRLSIASLCNPLIPSLFFRLFYEDEKATANSITTIVSMGSNIIAPKLGGHLMQHVSLDFPPLMGAGLYSLYATSYYFLLRNEKEKEVEPKLVLVKENE